MKVLLLENKFESSLTYGEAAIDRLVKELEDRNFQVTRLKTIDDAYALVASNFPFDCMLLTKTLNDPNSDSEVSVIQKLHERQPKVPVFLIADRGKINKISLKLAKEIREFIWILEDSLEFVIGRITFATKQYSSELLPPLTAAMRDYFKTYEYSWVIPGHQGGVGLTKTPAGRAFHDFYGQNLFNSDLNSARGLLGSLLGHSGAFKQSEQNIARIFGAHLSFSGVVGGSGSNRSIMQFCIKDGDPVAIDRNCHKSIAQGMVLTGAKPVYMVPDRNSFGIIGPISVASLKEVVAKKPVYGVVINCTFDGICYNSATIEQEMASVPHVHLDEAWFAYARFNPLYKNLYAMRGDPKNAKNSSAIFVTHSSHKMLNALGMGAYIHVRNGSRLPVDAAKFNQAYMMHTTTSPSYPIAASNDIAAQMMDGQTGVSLTQEVINEAIDFRQILARLHTEMTKKNEWYFKPWNVEQFEGLPFEDIPAKQLANDQKYWFLKPGDKWHGYKNLVDENWAFLDPIKVSILTPGIDADGKFSADGFGVPAALVNAWLVHKGIVPTRITDFQLMFLFTMGITKGKWGTLLEGLYSFKVNYDANTPIGSLLPEVTVNTNKYEGKGVQDVGIEMFKFIKDKNLPQLLFDAFHQLPAAPMTPHEGYQKLISNSEPVKLKDLANRIAATPILPYPPGIPMLISGERFGKSADTCPHIKYLLALEEWDKHFPGFGKETTGVEIDADGNHQVLCVVETKN